MKFGLILTSLLLVCNLGKASSGPSGFTYQGRLFQSNGIDPVDSDSVTFTIKIKSPDGLCVLFEETHVVDMSESEGVFSIVIGQGTNTGVSALNISETLNNKTDKVGAGGCNYSPSSGDARRLHLSYDDGSEALSLPTDQEIRSVPYAEVANSLSGYSEDDFVQISGSVTQSNISEITTLKTELVDLAEGNSSLYAKTSDISFSGGLLNLSASGVSVPDTPLSSSSAVNKNYVDGRFAGQSIDLSGLADGQTISWNSGGGKWEVTTLTQGTVTSITAGTGLTGGTITTSGTIGVDVGTTANKIIQLDGSGRLPAVDASQLTNLPLPPFSNRTVIDSSTNWSPPAGVNRVYIQVWGAGGGGAGGSSALSGGGAGGGAGGYGASFVTLADSSDVVVTIGDGGSGGSVNTSGSSGGASSFGAYLSSSGGAGGTVNSSVPILGGSCAALFNIAGGLGFPPMGSIGGQGGASFGGSPMPGSFSNGNTGSDGVSPGAGGGGGFGILAGGTAGGTGSKGRIIIWW